MEISCMVNLRSVGRDKAGRLLWLQGKQGPQYNKNKNAAKNTRQIARDIRPGKMPAVAPAFGGFVGPCPNGHQGKQPGGPAAGIQGTRAQKRKYGKQYPVRRAAQGTLQRIGIGREGRKRFGQMAAGAVRILPVLVGKPGHKHKPAGRKGQQTVKCQNDLPFYGPAVAGQAGS